MESNIDGKLFKSLITNGCQNLLSHREEVDNLNVFPVPDGDTGTNMHMTIEGGAKSIEDSDSDSIGDVGKQVSRAMTMSARGNSGVILSQFFKGVSLGLEGKDTVDVKEFSQSFLRGVEQAYSVVKNPVEGTILTVMRESAVKADQSLKDDSTLEDYFNFFIPQARITLQNTPELLDVLKEAGVIDSGGAGFLYIVEGMAMALNGKILEYVNSTNQNAPKVPLNHNFNADSRLEFGYCTEFILQLMNYKCNPKEVQLDEINKYLESMGDSIVSFKDDDIIKVHVHTFEPGVVLTHMQKYGEFVTVKIENMSVQHSNLGEHAPKLVKEKKREHKKYAVVAVANGAGITEEFKNCGADEIVTGGQTMNPSTESFINTFKKLDAENIYVFPNDSNIVMAAKQAAEAYTDAKVYVVESKTIAQCYAALAMLDYTFDDPDKIYNYFNEQVADVITGEVTYAIRDSSYKHIQIKKDNYIGLVDGDIVNCSKTKIDALIDMFNTIEDINDKEMCLLICGKDVTKEEQEEAVKRINQEFPSMEVSTLDGGQDVYSFIVSL